eukprot:TRINITY_DN5513_c0_g1::TRINITY_DN5513_c0_g1_i1::g.9409::m.9409 TRINITY_DN5513_c0_g1::TRINITY_DN5513_c0_g1_i1::g.9409  ORF type:complete len:222 (+),score=11.44,sp/Q58D06/WDR74_BOVIN/32.58/6e-26 TRINITY_DN5513_c0_g1_i1:39-704(+)
MWFLTGDETGYIRRVEVERKILKKWHASGAAENKSVDLLCWGPNGESEVGAARRNGEVTFWDVESGEVTATFSGFESEKIAGLDYLTRDSDSDMLWRCTESGLVEITRWGDTSDEESTRFSVKGPIARARIEPIDRQTFAIGGLENDLSLWNIETKEKIFTAKNLPNNSLDLRVPVWVSDIRFMPRSPTQIYVCTGYGEIRQYDTQVKRRPCLNLRISESR